MEATKAKKVIRNSNNSHLLETGTGAEVYCRKSEFTGNRSPANVSGQLNISGRSSTQYNNSGHKKFSAHTFIIELK